MEQDLLELMENLKSCLDTASERSDCLLDGKALSGTRELLQVHTGLVGGHSWVHVALVHWLGGGEVVNFK